MNLPFNNPVLIVALAMSIFLFMPALTERFRVPSIIGLILAGALVGPHTLGWLERDETIQLLGTVGLLYLMFIAGLELDLLGFRHNRRKSILFGCLSFALPMLLALVVSPYLGFGLSGTLMIGAIVASHTLLAYPVASRLGISKDRAVTATLGATILTDTLSLLTLAIVSGTATGEAGTLFWLRLLTSLALYTLLLLWGLPKLARWFFRHTDNQGAKQFIFLMVALFGSAFLAELAGAQPIIGAFLAGLTLNQLIPETSPLMNRVAFIGHTLFIPFFMLSVGMLVDFDVLTSTRVWLLAAALLGMVVLGKGGAALVAQRLFGYSTARGLLMVGMSIPQAAATLAVTFVGLELGLFNETVVNAVIVLILASCMVGPYLVERYGRQVALETETQPYDPSQAPQRIMVPLANPQTAEGLMELAMVLREPGSKEAIYPVTVVPGGEDASAQVAAAEKLLAHAVVYAAGAEVPTVPLTRVDDNPSSGMVRALAERRITEVVIGWNGQRSTEQRIFGSVIDQLLEHSKQQVMVCKLDQPLRNYQRLVVIIPPLIDHHPGYQPAIRRLKQLAARLNVSLLGLVVKGSSERIERDFRNIKPACESQFISVSAWPQLMRTLANEHQRHDLPMILSVRRGTLAWSAVLGRLPQLLAHSHGSFVALYPTSAPAVTRASADVSVPAELTPRRVRFDLPAYAFNKAVGELLSSDLPRRSSLYRTVLKALTSEHVGFATEFLPSAFLCHARVDDLNEAKMFLALSPAGITHPTKHVTRHLLAVLLSPATEPAPKHLARLEIGRAHV